MNDRDTIQTQLTEWLGTVEQQGALSKLVVIHAAVGGEVEVHALGDGTPGWKDPAKMADIVDAVATRHAKGLPGYQQFTMAASFGSAVRPTRFLPFGRMGAMHFGQGTHLGTDAPTPMGQVAQDMRLRENAHHLGVEMQKNAAHSQQHIIDVQSKRIAELEVDNRELNVAFIDLRRQMVEMQTETLLKVAVFARQSREREEWMRMTPAIINALSGHDVFPMSSADSAILQGLVEHSDPDLLDAEITRLTSKRPETAAALSARVKELRAQKAERDEELKRMARNAPASSMEDALAEVAGEARPKRLENGKNGAANGAHKPDGATADVRPPEPVSKLLHPDISLHWDLPTDRDAARKKVEAIAEDTAKELKVPSPKWDGDRADLKLENGTMVEILFGDKLRIKIKLAGLMTIFKSKIEEQLKAQVSEALR